MTDESDRNCLLFALLIYVVVSAYCQGYQCGSGHHQRIQEAEGVCRDSWDADRTESGLMHFSRFSLNVEWFCHLSGSVLCEFVLTWLTAHPAGCRPGHTSELAPENAHCCWSKKGQSISKEDHSRHPSSKGSWSWVWVWVKQKHCLWSPKKEFWSRSHNVKRF